MAIQKRQKIQRKEKGIRKRICPKVQGKKNNGECAFRQGQKQGIQKETQEQIHIFAGEALLEKVDTRTKGKIDRGIENKEYVRVGRAEK